MGVDIKIKVSIIVLTVIAGFIFLHKRKKSALISTSASPGIYASLNRITQGYSIPIKYQCLRYIKGLKPNLLVSLGFNNQIINLVTNAQGELYFNKQKQSIPTGYLPYNNIFISTQGSTLTDPSSLVNPGDPAPLGYFVPLDRSIPVPYQNGKWSSDPIPFTFDTTAWDESLPSHIIEGTQNVVFLAGSIGFV
jgi:hypothetical protein